MHKKKNVKPKSLMGKTIRTLCLFILPFNILSIVLSLFLMNNVRNTFRESIVVSLNSYTNILEQRMDHIDYLLYTYPNTDTNFVQLFLNMDNWHYSLYLYSISSSMEEVMNLSDSADAMFIYVPEKDDLMLVHDLKFSSGQRLPQLQKDDVLSLFNYPEYTSGKWNLVEVDNIQFLLRIVSYNNCYLGAYINCTDIVQKLNSDLNIDDVQLILSESEITSKNGYLLCSSDLSVENATLYCLIRNSYVSRSISVWLFGAIAFLLLSLFIIPLFIILFRKHINHPLIVLQNAFRKLEDGDETYRITEQASHLEFDHAFNSFNTMAQNTALLRQKAIEEERTQHALTLHNLNLKLDNLQLQIRPHFLSNTMNLLFTLIHNHQEENAKRLVLYITKYFRYMFRHGKEQELFDKELKLVEEYLAISEMHYNNAFTVSYQIDPVLSLMRFPPLLLHNFVENIIQHALIPGETVHIVIFGDYDEDQQMVTLQISDDGRGMTKEYTDMINHNNFSSVQPGKHIGIRNSINRLQYYYHGDASVSVESEANVGTTFTIQIRYNLTMNDSEENEEDEIQ